MGSAEESLFFIQNKALAVDIRLRAILPGYREKGLLWFSLDGEQSLSPISLKAPDPIIREGSSLSPTPFKQIGTFIHHTFIHITFR